MKIFFAILTLTLSFLFSHSTFANYICSGKVSEIAMTPTGQLYVSFGSINSVVLCNVSAAANGATTDACKSAQSILMAAKMADRLVDLYFISGSSTGDCTNAAHPSWSELNGWYYGPVLH